MRKLLAALLLTLNITTLSAQGTMTKQAFTTSDGSQTINYWLYTPSNATEEMPLIVYLHGGSGKGDDLDKLTSNDGFPKYLSDGVFGDLRAYVIIPQLKSTFKGWSDNAIGVRDLIVSTQKNYSIDSGNISLTGHSMGGTGTWSIALRFPKLFNKIAPMSGSIDNTEENVNTLSSLKIWACVGSADNIVDPQKSIDIINALKAADVDAKITVFEGVDHFGVPEYAYKDLSLGVVAWLIGKDSSTGIELPAMEETANGKCYDLQGRIIQKPSRGLYIMNGKVRLARCQ